MVKSIQSKELFFFLPSYNFVNQQGKFHYMLT